MKSNKKVAAAVDTRPATTAVLGMFTGKCCDSNVFNNNDMHLSRELFETLMQSDEYKRAMENRHYIGYLGHPADSDCQDFEHACIVMKDMRILDNGEIEGDFDLIDTPVGRVVKAFIDAGVKFGISIRGLGEVDGNGEVDPEGFIFRGFDLVTFPAYDDCIPEFKEVAASTDVKKKARYQKICASIDANLNNINSCEALELIKDQLPDNSDEFNKVQDRIDEIIAVPIEEGDISAEVADEKLEAMTELYLDAADSVRNLEQQLVEEQLANQNLIIECKTLKQKQARLNRIVANQIADATDIADDYQDKYERSVRQLQKVKASLSTKANELENVRSELKTVKTSLDRQVLANTRLESKLAALNEKRMGDRDAIRASDNLNLKYKQKIEASSEAISQKDSAIEDLKAKLNETVVASRELEVKASNLDEKNKELLSRVEAAEEMVSSYQQAYANIYANALGVYLTGLPITASTSVEELTDMIKAGTSTASMPSAPDYSEEEDIEYIDASEDDSDIEDLLDDANYSAELVTM